jgi:hypothetical protein
MIGRILKFLKENIISVRVTRSNVKASVRRWHPDPKGPEVAPNGERGYYSEWIPQESHNLLTDAGRDFLHLQGYETSGLGANGGNYIAVSSDATAPDDADTTLTGEITTGGLARAQGTVAHTAGTNSTTITKIFTATSTHTDVQKAGLFTAASSGTLVHENTFANPVTLATFDQLKVEWSITVDD